MLLPFKFYLLDIIRYHILKLIELNMNVIYDKLFTEIYYIVTLEMTFQIQCKVLHLKNQYNFESKRGICYF